MTTRAFVLLSGGIDSTTVLFQAIADHPEVEAISINYGQRHSGREIFIGRFSTDRRAMQQQYVHAHWREKRHGGHLGV